MKEKAQKFAEDSLGEKVEHVSSWTSLHAFRTTDGYVVVVNWDVFEQRHVFDSVRPRVKIALGIEKETMHELSARRKR